jgi:hypothetical protein
LKNKSILFGVTSAGDLGRHPTKQTSKKNKQTKQANGKRRSIAGHTPYMGILNLQCSFLTGFIHPENKQKTNKQAHDSNYYMKVGENTRGESLDGVAEVGTVAIPSAQ